MAPECIEEGIFITGSDMWAYGVLLYEILTFGSVPYHDMNSGDVLSFIKNGNRLAIPSATDPLL